MHGDGLTGDVLVVAGESSGDLHAGALVRELRRLAPGLRVVAMGGPRLREAGAEILLEMAEVQTMGTTEALRALGRLRNAYRFLRGFLESRRPRLVILVDFPEFNLRLAARAKRAGVHVFYFVGPQVWAWRRGRVRKVVRYVDRLAVVFPFEPSFYNGRREIATFVGHPLLDLARPTRPPDATRRLYGLSPGKPLLAILPGSREGEIRAHLPPMLEAARRLSAGGWEAVVAFAPWVGRERAVRWSGGCAAACGDTFDVLCAAQGALVASGTATLEAALARVPAVVVYRANLLTYALGRLLVRVPYLAMPNLLLGRELYPELLQSRVTAENMIRALEDVVARRAELEGGFDEVRGRLGRPGAARRAAELALDLLRRGGTA
ncbi:MAG: lipid-A-disaccharide synthase [Candidatus Binatia bacterium]|nr:MAG: lipid-A-disaccharide synthase [Candidatus Binatia bacterium]